MGSIGMVIIDEACWPRAIQEERLPLDELMLGTAGSAGPRAGADPDADMADLNALRVKLRDALSVAVDPMVSRSVLSYAGLTEEACRLAAKLEERLVRNPKLRPGMPKAMREMPRRTADSNLRARAFVALWAALSDLLAGGAERNGRVLIEERGGRNYVVVRGVKRIHIDLRGKPVLHLDATLRPELARTVLPHLRHGEVDATAPNMRVTLVSGSFGKSMLCPASGLSPAEANRRANRRRERVDFVRWQAARVAPGPVLVITYKSIEEAFCRHSERIRRALQCHRRTRRLPGREVPHRHRPAASLHARTAPARRRPPRPCIGGRYRKATRGVRMRDGSGRAVEVIEHGDAKVELLRAAICDDELIQAIGRGRGVNRTADTPLDVHVLADVALPLVHDRVLQWDATKPDIVQRMLLAGVAVDSPADAARLHLKLFSGVRQAEQALSRARFTRQNPIRDPYREMSVKSAAYRRAGRGRSWQRAYWLFGSSDYIRHYIASVLGDLSGWKADGD